MNAKHKEKTFSILRRIYRGFSFVGYFQLIECKISYALSRQHGVPGPLSTSECRAELW